MREEWGLGDEWGDIGVLGGIWGRVISGVFAAPPPIITLCFASAP